MTSSASPSSNNVEKTLSSIKSVLAPLKTSLDFVPVAGVDKIVPAILVLLERVEVSDQNTRIRAC